MTKGLVLVIGGAGFIGAPLACRLARDGRTVCAISRHRPRTPIRHPRAQFVRGSFGRPGTFRRLLDRADQVYHLGWTMLPAASEKDAWREITENVVGSAILFNTIRKSKVSHLVFISSGGMVYGTPRVFPTPEEHPTAPVSVHGLAKLFVENLARTISREKSKKVSILRLSNVYGESQDPGRGFGFVAAALWAAKRREPLPVWGNGKIIRDYLYLGDAIEALVLLPGQGNLFEVFNVGTGVGSSQTEIIRRVEQGSGRRLKLRFLPGRKFDVPKSVLDVRKAARAGWRPHVELTDGIRLVWEKLAGSPRSRI